MRGKHLATRTLAIGLVLAVSAALVLPGHALAQSTSRHSGEVTITAERAEILQGIDDLVFTITREFATGNELDVTVTMSPGILPFNRLSHTVTIPANDTSATLTVSTFQRNPGAVTGDVTATVGGGPDHDVGDPSTASTLVHVGRGLVTLSFSGSSMRVDEGVGASRDEVRLIARTSPNVPPPRNGFSVSVFTGERTAKRGVDYRGFSLTYPIYGEPRGNWVADGDTYVSSTQVTVWPIDDDRDEGDEHFAVQVQTLPFHPPAVRLVPPDPSAPPCARSFCVSNVVIVDDDTRGVTVGESGTLLVEEGSSASYTVMLDSEPTSDVTVTPAVEGASGADISVSGPLTFTPRNWHRRQPVTVTASVDDNAVDGSATIVHAVSGGDYGDNGVTAAPVTVQEDDREADLVHSGEVTITAEHATALAGIDDLAFTVTRQVSAGYDLDVPVTLSAGIIPADGLARTATIDAGSVSTDLIISTSSLDPDAATGDVTATVGDGLLHDVGDPATATVRVHLGESMLTVRLDRGTYSLDEGAGTTTGEIGLIARTEPNVPPPTAGVAMSVSAIPGTAKAGEDYQGPVAVIDLPEGESGDWTADGDSHTARVPVPVEILDDGLVEGDETFRLRLDQASWLTAAISLIPADAEAAPCTSEGCDALVTIVDDDTRAVIVDQIGPLSVTEGGIATYTVVLDSEPTGDVTVTPRLTGTVDAELSISPARLTFTTRNWRSPQQVTVTAKTDGNLTDGSATIDHKVSGGDYEANRVRADSVPVVEQDAERDAVVVTLVHVPDGTVIPSNSTVAVGGTVIDGTTFSEDEQVFFRLLFSAADGGPAPNGVDVELSFEWTHFSPIVPVSGEVTRVGMSLPRVDVWDSAVEILDNDVGNPDSTMTIRITGCERNTCVIGESSEITVTIADDDGGPAAAVPGQPEPSRLVCASAGDGYDPTGIAVSWQAPTFVGGAPVEDYDVRYRRQNPDQHLSLLVWESWPHTGLATSTTIAGLDADARYEVEVRAVNANGPGQWSQPHTFWTGYLEDQCRIIDRHTP